MVQIMRRSDSLRGKTVAIIGFGNQGRAHAHNLRDSGIEVVVGSRLGSEGGKLAAASGFASLPIAERFRAAI